MYSINVSNVPGVLPGVHLSTACVRYSSSASLTSILHLTMHASRLELGPKSQALILFLWSQADQPKPESQSDAIRSRYA